MPGILDEEIASQPAVVARLLDREAGPVGQMVAHLPPCDYVLIAARGSSDHAALYAKYVWGALAGRTVALATPSLFTLYDQPPRLTGALVMGISQSGQSPDIVAVLDEARRQGRPTIAVTNEAASPLAAAADHVILLDAGIEQSIAATKTYTAQLAVVALLAACWSGDATRQAELARMPETLDATLALAAPALEAAADLRDITTLVTVARGYNYATAYEVALKVKELATVPTEPYSAADFRHGPIASIDPGAPVVLVMPSGRTLGDMLDLAAQLRSREARLYVLSDAAEALAHAALKLPLPSGIPEWLSPLAAVVPGQHLALAIARARGLDPEHPRGLHKVTRTR